MLYTLSDARSLCRPFVDGGSCKDATVDARINEALERLMEEQPWECLRRVVRVTTCNRILPLPHNVEKITAACLDGGPSRIFNQAYQFLSSGPGDLDYQLVASGIKDLVDQGDYWPIMFDVPKKLEIDDEEVFPEGLQLCAFAANDSDRASPLVVTGFTSTGEEVTESIQIQPWQGGVEGQLFGNWNEDIKLSTNSFQDVTAVIKPATTGYVSLYAVYPTESYMFMLAKYHPNQTRPNFRRYIINNSTQDTRTCMLLQVQIRYQPLAAATDVLPVDSLQAVKLMVMAISEENKQNIPQAITLAQQAVNLMAKREETRTLSTGAPTIVNTDYRVSLGRAMNRRGRIL